MKSRKNGTVQPKERGRRVKAFIYRTATKEVKEGAETDHGVWMVTRDEGEMAQNMGSIRGAAPSLLPTRLGLSFLVKENDQWCSSQIEIFDPTTRIAPPVVILSGDVGPHSRYLGRYEIEEGKEINGKPVYRLSLDSGKRKSEAKNATDAYLYRWVERMRFREHTFARALLTLFMPPPRANTIAPRSIAKDAVDVARLSELEADEGGRWQVTRSAEHMVRGHGYIRSLSAAEVVSEPGLKWAFQLKGKWQSANISVSTPKASAVTIFGKRPSEDSSPQARSSQKKTFGERFSPS